MSAVGDQTQTLILDFFDSVFGENPQQTTEKGWKVYSIPIQGFSIKTDTYGGIHFEITQINKKIHTSVKENLSKLTKDFKKSGAFDSVWLDFTLPVNLQTVGEIAPNGFKIGTKGRCDLIYNYQKNQIHVWKWLSKEKECPIPAGATHNLGATAAIIDLTAQKVLLVVNARRSTAWNFPGGSFEPGIDSTPMATALREAREETGLELPDQEIKDQKLVAQIEFPLNQFAPAINQVWAFFLEDITSIPLNPPEDEIREARWIQMETLLGESDTFDEKAVGPEIKAALEAIKNGRGMENVSKLGWMSVHSSS